MTLRVRPVVLAAGAGSRFGGGKLRAQLGGRAILQHVLDALAAAGLDDPIVVLGADAPELEAAMAWRAARRVRNPEPGRGLSSSLQLGWAAALEADPPPDAVLVVLGDQPRLDPAVVRALAGAPLDPEHPVLVAQHADGARNPVRIEPDAAALIARASGDRGLGPLIDASPGLVRTLEVASVNPDVDARVDLVALLEADWAARVAANAAQVEEVREAPDGPDFYAKVSRTFVADPARADDPVLAALDRVARPADTWLDVGAGAGRYALPIARRVRAVIAVDPSSSMLDALSAGAREHGIGNVTVHAGRWPADAALRRALGPDPVADVALIAHVGYDIAAIGPFVSALEQAARRACVAVLMHQSPAAVAAPFWPPVHGRERIPLPALPDFLELLAARGIDADVTTVEGERRHWDDRDELLTLLRRQLWTEPGSPADRRLEGAVDRLTERAADGSLTIPSAPRLDVGIVTWRPPGSR